MNRPPVSKKTRFEVFKRDAFRCQYCGRTPPVVILHADHIVAVANGGDSQQSNLITSCSECNLGKGARPLDQVPASLKDQIAEKRERAAQVEAYNQSLLELREAELATLEELGRYWFNKFEIRKNKYVFGTARVGSVRTFLRHIAPADIMDAMDIAHDRFPSHNNDFRTFRYFCGICWRKIKGNG